MRLFFLASSYIAGHTNTSVLFLLYIYIEIEVIKRKSLFKQFLYKRVILCHLSRIVGSLHQRASVRHVNQEVVSAFGVDRLRSDDGTFSHLTLYCLLCIRGHPPASLTIMTSFSSKWSGSNPMTEDIISSTSSIFFARIVRTSGKRSSVNFANYEGIRWFGVNWNRHVFFFLSRDQLAHFFNFQLFRWSRGNHVCWISGQSVKPIWSIAARNGVCCHPQNYEWDC